MLWFQSLQGNCDECCTLIYGSIIPGFPSPVHSIDWGKCRYFSRAEGEEIVQTIRGSENREQGTISSQLHLSTEKENDGMYALLPHPNPLYVIGDIIIYRKWVMNGPLFISDPILGFFFWKRFSWKIPWISAEWWHADQICPSKI